MRQEFGGRQVVAFESKLVKQVASSPELIQRVVASDIFQSIEIKSNWVAELHYGGVPKVDREMNCSKGHLETLDGRIESYQGGTIGEILCFP
jgi:hypothetical protein